MVIVEIKTFTLPHDLRSELLGAVDIHRAPWTTGVHVQLPRVMELPNDDILLLVPDAPSAIRRAPPWQPPWRGPCTGQPPWTKPCGELPLTLLVRSHARAPPSPCCVTFGFGSGSLSRMQLPRTELLPQDTTPSPRTRWPLGLLVPCIAFAATHHTSTPTVDVYDHHSEQLPLMGLPSTSTTPLHAHATSSRRVPRLECGHGRQLLLPSTEPQLWSGE